MDRIEEIRETWNKAYKGLVNDLGNQLTIEDVACMFFELGWRAADEYKSKKQSIIKWQTGTPQMGGEYWVCLKNRSVTIDTFLVGDGFESDWKRFNKSYIVAWCKLSDIKPYKEE